MELCLALDRPTLSDNLELVRELQEFNIWLKIGYRSYIRDGNRIIEELKNIS